MQRCYNARLDGYHCSDRPSGRSLSSISRDKTYLHLKAGLTLIYDMQDGVLARILRDVDAPALSAAEWVCWRFRKIGELPQRHCSPICN